jgi:hypothetical protein
MITKATEHQEKRLLLQSYIGLFPDVLTHMLDLKQPEGAPQLEYQTEYKQMNQEEYAMIRLKFVQRVP